MKELLFIQYRLWPKPHTREQGAGPVQSFIFLPYLEQEVSVVAVSPQHETNLSFTLKMVLVLFFPLKRLLMHCTLNSH